MFETTAVTLGDLSFDVRSAGPDQGTPIVLLHGFPETGRSWNAVARALVDHGLRVLVPDQRGYSPGARPADVSEYTLDKLVTDVIGLLDAFGLDTAHLAGHDWGAVVAWQTAVRHPDRILSLTAVSVPHPAAFGWALRNDPDQQARSSYFALLREEGKAESVLLEDDARRLRAMYGQGVESDAVDEYVRTLSEPGALTGALNWYRAMTRDFGDIPPVRVPATYVWSTGDSAMGAAAAERCGEFVEADYEFVVVPDISHWVPEEAPGAVADAVRARVRKCR
ncbi:alpha/beta fold hydrolase [Rhodococcus chondri]|uniref:Alpha/beta hydrolase n=1 Tax=Rhodococcus chondri TaxID=3065941 RepID=A0ABU7JQS4_9NOCA|nr:alpha/beta hydrolase [Rhodococcus sp. CC-R104]MEE2032376.1 alpha/beta hydrolase [Rhodococcus sp. CC-R104]